MKNIVINLFIVFLFLTQNADAQIFNWNSLNNTKHILTADIGIDYSVSYGVNYARKLNAKLPIIIYANFSMPAGEHFLDDFKTKIGAQILLLNSPNFKGSISLNGIFRKYQTQFVSIQNFGSEMKGTFGYYRPKWFLATEISFDKAIVSHFNHTDYFKENIYPNVVNGWYEPTTGGNLLYGMHAGLSFKKLDITLRLGKVITQDFKTAPLIPIYLALGMNLKLPNLQ